MKTFNLAVSIADVAAVAADIAANGKIFGAATAITAAGAGTAAVVGDGVCSVVGNKSRISISKHYRVIVRMDLQGAYAVGGRPHIIPIPQSVLQLGDGEFVVGANVLSIEEDTTGNVLASNTLLTWSYNRVVKNLYITIPDAVIANYGAAKTINVELAITKKDY